MQNPKNRGTGAGGKNTNKNGLSFEKKTDLERFLCDKGFVKKELGKRHYYLFKKIKEGFYIYYATKGSFNKILDKILSKKVYKIPDEGFLIKKGGVVSVKIIEKKNQNVQGSVFEKMYTPVYVRDVCYKKNLSVETDYCYVVNSWLWDVLHSECLKCNDLLEYYEENNIKVFSGETADYFNSIYEWIKN